MGPSSRGTVSAPVKASAGKWVSNVGSFFGHGCRTGSTRARNFGFGHLLKKNEVLRPIDAGYRATPAGFTSLPSKSSILLHNPHA
jgi:hypothetical protein